MASGLLCGASSSVKGTLELFWGGFNFRVGSKWKGMSVNHSAFLLSSDLNFLKGILTLFWVSSKSRTNKVGEYEWGIGQPFKGKWF